jgi:hypothetical protein
MQKLTIVECLVSSVATNIRSTSKYVFWTNTSSYFIAKSKNRIWIKLFESGAKNPDLQVGAFLHGMDFLV